MFRNGDVSKPMFFLRACTMLAILSNGVLTFLPTASLWPFVFAPLLSLGLLVLHCMSDWKWPLIFSGLPMVVAYGGCSLFLVVLHSSLNDILNAFTSAASSSYLVPAMPFLTIGWLIHFVFAYFLVLREDS